MSHRTSRPSASSTPVTPPRPAAIRRTPPDSDSKWTPAACAAARSARPTAAEPPRAGRIQASGSSCPKAWKWRNRPAVPGARGPRRVPVRIGPASAALSGSLSNQSSRKSASAMGSVRRSPLTRFAPSPRAAKAAGIASGSVESSWSGGCSSNFRKKPANAPTSATNSGKRAASLGESPATASRACSGSRGSAKDPPSHPQTVSTGSGATSSSPWRSRSRSPATAGSSEGRVSGNTGN